MISWAAMVATVIAAFMTAANLGPRVTGYGFAVFFLGSVCWLISGIITGEPALTWTNAVLTFLNLFGVWRWLGRQTSVEEGGRTAAQASESTPGEALFPVSLLSRARVACSGTEIGHCIDAMAGCDSGRLDYLVVSEGGIAGVGETLRRLPWHEAHVDGDTVLSRIGADRFARLERLSRDEWPGR
jgi:hypothetical protein